MTFADRLRSYGDAPALLWAGGSLSYAALADRVAAFAARLGSGRRLVLVQGGNDADAVTAYLACLSGRHPVLLSPPGAPLESLVAAYDPDVVVRGPLVEERRAGSAHAPHEDLALLLSTSGSTGSPKLVRLSYDNVESNAAAIASYLGIRPDDRAATTLPMHYCYGLSVLNSHLLSGAAVVLTELSVVDPCFWALFREVGATTFPGVPYTFDLLDRAGFADMDLPTLRYVTQAGGRLAPERVRAYAELGRRRGWDLWVMYGQTEATARMAYLPPDLALSRPEAIGVPVPGGSFAIEDGELVYTGPNVMLGYADSPADLALGRTVSRLRTGDLAREVDGLYEVVGRRGRFVKAFGLRLDLDRIEALLRERGVVTACAPAAAGARLVVAGEGSAGGGRAAVADRCGIPARAVSVHAVATLPRTAGGKVDYAAVTALAGSAAPPPRRAGSLREAYAEVLERPGVCDADTFVSLGGDSLSYVELSLRVEELLGHLPPAWHVTPIGLLAPAPGKRRRLLRSVETSVVLRALAILAVVVTHAGLLTVAGGAHVLLAVAGFNFARFHLTAAAPSERTRHAVRSAARLAVPTAVWVGAVAAVGGSYSLLNVLLLNGLAGPPALGPAWRLWFVEVLVYLVLAVTLLVRVADRVERRAPFAFAMAVVGLGLLTRVAPVRPGADRLVSAHVILWLFALGWAAAKSSRWQHRALVSAVLLATVPGFFDTTVRDLTVAGGVLLLVWVPSVRVPAPLVRPAGALAAASLYVYLTHWQVFPHLEPRSPFLAVVASLAAGLAYWWLATSGLAHARGTVVRVLGPSRAMSRARPRLDGDESGERGGVRQARPAGVAGGEVRHERAHDAAAADRERGDERLAAAGRGGVGERAQQHERDRDVDDVGRRDLRRASTRR